MARKRLQDILLWCVPLVFVPGCQHFPATRSIAGEFDRPGAAPTSPPALDAEVAASALPEGKVISSAIAQDPIVQRQTNKKSQPPPEPVRRVDNLPESPIQRPVAELPNTPKADLARPTVEVNGSAAAGQPGVVTPGIDLPDIEPIKATAAFQINPPPTLPQLVMPENKKPEKRAPGPFLKALQLMLEERHQEAIQHLRAYDQETEEFFLRLAPTLIMLVKKPIDELSPPEVAVLSDQLSSLLAVLRPRSELRINNMCYCRRIDAFGSIKSLPDNHAFLAGSSDRPGELVQVYAELKNFASDPAPEGDFVTKLACTLELRDTSGNIVWTFTYDRRDTTHRRLTRLNDFHSNFSFCVPVLAPGAYLLTIQIADETNPELRRVARKSLDFRVTPVGGQSSSR